MGEGGTGEQGECLLLWRMPGTGKLRLLIEEQLQLFSRVAKWADWQGAGIYLDANSPLPTSLAGRAPGEMRSFQKPTGCC